MAEEVVHFEAEVGVEAEAEAEVEAKQLPPWRLPPAHLQARAEEEVHFEVEAEGEAEAELELPPPLAEQHVQAAPSCRKERPWRRVSPHTSTM